jgi:tryptophanyl-tRNA synthetase
MKNPQPTILSGVQPSGVPSIGNYLGAFLPFSRFLKAKSHRVYMMVVDHHAITVRQDPKDLHENTLAVAAWYIASGLNPADCTLFVQSHVSQHAELGWILNTFTQMGELERMTQYKDKAKQHSQNINAGLFTYPALMAADILLYDATEVPVGDDQTQHLELARDIATRVNNLYCKKIHHIADINREHLNKIQKDLKKNGFNKYIISKDLKHELAFMKDMERSLSGDDKINGWENPVFVIPEARRPQAAARVRDLQEPERKMSKSRPGAGTVLLTESPDEIAKKFKRAVTDTVGAVKYDPVGQPGVANLMEIMAACTNRTPKQVEEEFAGQQYGPLKSAVAETVVQTLEPVQAEYKRLMADKGELQNILAKGAESARVHAEQTLVRVMRTMGYVLPPHRL